MCNTFKVRHNMQAECDVQGAIVNMFLTTDVFKTFLGSSYLSFLFISVQLSEINRIKIMKGSFTFVVLH